MADYNFTLPAGATVRVVVRFNSHVENGVGLHDRDTNKTLEGKNSHATGDGTIEWQNTTGMPQNLQVHTYHKRTPPLAQEGWHHSRVKVVHFDKDNPYSVHFECDAQSYTRDDHTGRRVLRWHGKYHDATVIITCSEPVLSDPDAPLPNVQMASATDSPS